MLATLCSICSAPASLYKDVFCTRKKDDDSQLLRRLRTTFSYELTHLAAKGFSTCKTLALKHFKDILDDIIVTMFDFEAINAYPTCNLDLLLKLGGEYSKRKGALFLKKSQNTEEDGFGYKSHDLWSWCEDTGKLFLELDCEDSHIEPDEKSWIISIGRAFQSACANIQRDHANEELATSSAEEECMKRRQLLRLFFASMRQNTNSSGDLSSNENGMVSNITRRITHNVFYLSKTVAYYEEQLRWGCEDNDSRYKRAQIRAYDDAYIGFCGSVLSDMLNENSKWVRFVKNSITHRLESAGVDTLESETLLKLLGRVFATSVKYLTETPSGLASREEDLGIYCEILRTLKACLCDQLAARTENNGIKYIFSCTMHIIAKLQIKIWDASSSLQISQGIDVVYILKFAKWLKLCGMIMQEEKYLLELCELLTKLKSTNRDDRNIGEPTNPKFKHLIAAFDTLSKIEEDWFRRISNPYASKQRMTSNAGRRSGQHFKLSRSCLRAVDDFIDTTFGFVEMTEEEYRASVEVNRAREDFVVDDDGLGYYDGLGMTDEEYRARVEVNRARQDDDDGLGSYDEYPI